jgi:hypothetical protein
VTVNARLWRINIILAQDDKFVRFITSISSDTDSALIESIALGYGVIYDVPNILEAMYPAYNDVISAHVYQSPRWKDLTVEEENVRDIAYSIKNHKSDKIKEAAIDMSRYVDGNSILIPIPNSRGDTASNRLLANAIEDVTTSTVLDILGTSGNRESNLVRGKEGKPRLSPKEMGLYIKGHPTSSKIYFIDNVATSGATIQAARNLLGAGVGLVYAKVPNNLR